MISTVFLSGCFSAIARSGEGWSGEKTPAKTKVVAGVADAVTIPVQAPFLIVSGVGAANRTHDTSVRNKLVEEIQRDPELIFQKKIHLSKSRSKREAIDTTLWDHNTPFTDTQLRRLFAELDWRKAYVLSNPHCSLSFLNEVKQDFPKLDRWERNRYIENMCQNPIIPLSWLQEWADDVTYYGATAAYAKSWYQRRNKANQP